MAANQPDATSVLNGRPRVNSRYESGADFQIINRVKAVLNDVSLSFSERCLLAHLMLSAGEKGEAVWRQSALEQSLGMSDRQIRRATRKIEGVRKLCSVQRGLRRANSYLMPWHPEFDRTCKSAQTTPDRTPMSDQDRTPMSDQDRTPMSDPYRKDFSVKDVQGKEKSSSGASAQPEAAQTTIASPVMEKLSAFFQEHGYRLPKKGDPTIEISALLKAGDADLDDLDAFLERYRRRLDDPPQTWKHVTTSLERWLESDEGRRSVTARLSERQAERDREAAEKRKELLRDTPMEPKETRGYLANGLMGARWMPPIPDALLDELAAMGIERISPRELVSRFKAWKPCERCGGEGIVDVSPGTFGSDVAWCLCATADRKRKSNPGYVSTYNERQQAVRDMGARLMSNSSPKHRDQNRKPCGASSGLRPIGMSVASMAAAI